jgi:hypothetical protein
LNILALTPISLFILITREANDVSIILQMTFCCPFRELVHIAKLRLRAMLGDYLIWLVRIIGLVRIIY